MEIVTGSTGQVHVTPIDDAVRNSNIGYLSDKVVFTCFRNFEATAITNNEVRIYSGYGMNQGRIFKIDDDEWDTVTIENGSQGYKRADLIVARYTMNTQTGFEDISLVAIRGNSGSSYVDPTYSTGNINDGATIDDFPLYRVRLNGFTIEGLDRLFTLVPDGGRLGELEAKVAAHKAEFNALNIRTNLASESAVYPKNGANARPGVEGVLPANHGGSGANNLKTGANNFIGALDTNGTAPVDGDYYIGTTPNTAGYQRKPLTALKAWVEEKIKALLNMGTGTIVPVTNGGTGKGSITLGSVLVGNGTNTPTERAIDTNPTLESNNFITSGAVAEALASKGYGDMLRATYDPNLDGIIGVANGGTGSSDGTLNGVKLAVVNGVKGYYDGSTFKSFRQPTGNAAVGDVLSGKTFANASSDALTGTMPNRGSATRSINAGSTSSISAGYYSGGTITANRYHDDNTYTFGSNSGGTVDLGQAHNYRRVNATNVYNTGYNAGVAAQKAVTWTETLYLKAIKNDSPDLQMDAKNITKIKLVSTNDSSQQLIRFRGYGDLTPTRNNLTEDKTVIHVGEEITLKSTTKSIFLAWGSLLQDTNYTLQITRTCNTRY